MLTLEDLARDRVAERVRESERNAWLAQARRDAASYTRSAHAANRARLAHTATIAQVANTAEAARAANPARAAHAADPAPTPQAIRPTRTSQLAAPRQALAAALRLLAARLDSSLIVTSTRTESVPIQPHSQG